MSGLRIAIVTDIDPEEGSRYWIEALGELSRRGIAPHLVTVRASGVLDRDASSVAAGTLALGARSAKGYPLAAMRLRSYVKAHSIDVVHASEPIPGVIAAPRAPVRSARLLGFSNAVT